MNPKYDKNDFVANFSQVKTNTIYILSDKLLAISAIEFWNYSKTP